MLAIFVAGAAPATLCAQDGLSAGQAAATLRQLVLLHLEWRGPAYDQLQSLHERGTFEDAAGRRSDAIWMDRDGRRRIETDGADGRQIEAAAPDGAWRAGVDGKPADDPGGYEAARRYAALVFGDALTGRGGAEVALAGSAEAEDHTWTVVRVTFGDADTYDVLLEPWWGRSAATGSPRRASPARCCSPTGGWSTACASRSAS